MNALAPGLRRVQWSAPLLGALFGLALLHLTPGGPAALALTAAATGALVVWIAWQDLTTLTVPDAALAAVAAVGFAFRWSGAVAAGEAPGRILVALALDVALCGGMLLAFREVYYRRKGVDGLGLGDCKLAAAGALLVGGVGFSWALFCASLAALAAVGTLRLLRPAAAPLERLAFGAVLAPALWLVWLAEEALPRLSGS